MFDYRIFYPQLGIAEQRQRRPTPQRVTRLTTDRRVRRSQDRR